MVLYDTAVGSSGIHIVGFTDRPGAEAMKPLDALIRRAFVVTKPGYVIALPGLARPEYGKNGGAAGICAGTPGEIAEYFFEIDTPQPRCSVVHGWQRLRLVNHLSSLVVARLGNVVLFVPAGKAVTLKEPFERYLLPGGYGINAAAPAGGEVRYDI
jgi:hypothetical protein